MTTESEYLIIGQGLAGSCLAHELQQAGKSVAIIDKGDKEGASWIGAGIMNPLVLRYITQGWKAEILLPYARNFYSELEKELNITLIYDLPIARILTENEHKNWKAKVLKPEIGQWTNGALHFPFHPDHIINDFGVVIINDTARVDMATLVSSLREVFIQHKIYHEQTFDYEDLHKYDEGFKYKGINARYVIFCEGYQSVTNPYFRWIPYRPVKGELLKLYIPNLEDNFIINRHVFILPLGNRYFKLGSGYDWNDLSNKPTPQARDTLLKKAKEILRIPFDLVDHTAGIRPSVADRRPVVGAHPKYRNMFILNGLGAKGAMLAPYMARQLVDLMVRDKPVIREVDPARFFSP